MTEFPQFLNEKVKMNGNEIILRVNPGGHPGADVLRTPTVVKATANLGHSEIQRGTGASFEL